MRNWILVIVVLTTIFVMIDRSSNKASRSIDIKKILNYKKIMVADSLNEIPSSIPIKTGSLNAGKTELEELVLDPVNIDAATLVSENKFQIGKIFDQAQGRVLKLGTCLQTANRCGQKPEGKYFDPDNTPEHRNLNRSLMVIAEVIRQNPQFLSELDRAPILDLTRINNDNTPILAAQILLQNNVSDEEFLVMIRNSGSLRGVTRSVYLGLLARPQDNLRAAYTQAVYTALTDSSDRFTAMEVQKNLGSYNLGKKEFITAIQKSCYLRDNDSGEDFWPMIRRNIATQSQLQGYNINPDMYCQN